MKKLLKLLWNQRSFCKFGTSHPEDIESAPRVGSQNLAAFTFFFFEDNMGLNCVHVLVKISDAYHCHPLKIRFCVWL